MRKWVIWFFSNLLINWEVKKLAWPQFTDKKNPRYIKCRRLWPYSIHRVLKSSVITCGSGATTKTQKSGLTSGHSKWPGDMILKSRRSPLADIMKNWWINSHAEFRGATCRSFSAIHEKLQGELITAPPPSSVRGLRRPMHWYAHENWRHHVSQYGVRVTGRGVNFWKCSWVPDLYLLMNTY